MRGAWGWTIFGIVWGIAIGGITVTILLLDKLKALLVLSYVAMGLIVVIAFKPMIQMVPRGMIIWLFIGGACYLLGIIFYLWKKLPYHHPIWHIFVLGGSMAYICPGWKYLPFFRNIILSHLKISLLTHFTTLSIKVLSIFPTKEGVSKIRSGKR